MISAGVKELKNRLSQYLMLVKQGEKVMITEHGRIIAEISLPASDTVHNNIEKTLEQMAKEGKLIKAKRTSCAAVSSGENISLDWISEYQDSRA